MTGVLCIGSKMALNQCTRAAIANIQMLGDLKKKYLLTLIEAGNLRQSLSEEGTYLTLMIMMLLLLSTLHIRVPEMESLFHSRFQLSANVHPRQAAGKYSSNSLRSGPSVCLAKALLRWAEPREGHHFFLQHFPLLLK